MTDLIAELCARFGLGEPASSRRVGGTRNLSFAVKTDRGKWVARRRYEGYADPERVAFDHAALRLLADNGVPVVAPCVSVDGQSYATVRSSEAASLRSTSWRTDSQVWEVYPFAAGRHLREGHRNDVLALARSLANFHRVGQSFELRYDKLGPRGETDPGHLLA
ncbi:MAG TPA: phosphotransferase, partial [Armatimonadota bacterium]|nr:phosphotransferase [Armatimonadota bacterium]